MPQISQGNLMSRAAFARHMGVSPRTITDRIRAGTVIVDKATNLIKVREFKARWLAPGPALGRGDVQEPDRRSTLPSGRSTSRPSGRRPNCDCAKARGGSSTASRRRRRCSTSPASARQLPLLAGPLRGDHRGQAAYGSPPDRAGARPVHQGAPACAHGASRQSRRRSADRRHLARRSAARPGPDGYGVRRPLDVGRPPPRRGYRAKW